MTATDLIRSVRGSGGDSDGLDRGRWPSARAAALRGAAAALCSAVVVVGLVLLGWAGTSRSTVGLMPTLGLGVDGWLLAHGSRVVIGQVHVALTPLVLWAGLVTVIAYAARPLVPALVEDGDDDVEPLPWQDRVRPLAAFAGGYVIVAALLGLLTLSDAARPDPVTVVPAVLATLLVGALLAAWRAEPEGEGIRALLPDAVRVPMTLRRAVKPALWGAGSLLAAGATLVVGAVVLSASDVFHVQAELGAGLVGGVLLTVAQLLYLPNLALWAMSFMAGSGFQVVSGAPTTWTGSKAGLMPMVPVFAALPSPGGFPVVMGMVALVPVAAGVLVGRRSLGTVARLSPLRVKALVAGTAAVLAALGLGVLDALAGGSLGAYRLADMGAPALTMTGLLAAELLVGALGVVVWDVWRLHRH